MNTLEKIWFEGADEYKIVFNYNPAVASVFAGLEVFSMTQPEYGDIDIDDQAYFPGNYTLTIANYDVRMYNPFKNFLEAYNKKFPFNFKDVFYIDYYKNKVLRHQGVLSNQNYDDGEETIELEITSGTEYYKRVNMAQPEFLDRLAELGLPKKEIVMPTGARFYTYGLDNVIIEGRAIKPGPPAIADFPVKKFIETIFTAVNPDCAVDIRTDLLFGTEIDAQDKTIGDVMIYDIHSNYLGRYVVTPLNSAGLPFFADDIWEIVQETSAQRVYEPKEFKNSADKNLMSVIKSICNNFILRPGFETFNEIKLLKKYSIAEADAIEITDNDIVDKTYKKNTFVPPVKYLKVRNAFVNDVFPGTDAERGFADTYLANSDKLQIDVQLSAFRRAAGGSEIFYSIYLFIDGNKKPVLWVKDPVSGYKNSLGEVIAELEWRARRQWLNRLPSLLWGADWRFGAHYRFRAENNQIVTLRPMKMQPDEDTNTTKAEFIQIGPL